MLTSKPPVIQRYAGRDGSDEYNSIHAPSLIQSELDASKRMGDFDKNSPGAEALLAPKPAAAAAAAAAALPGRKPRQRRPLYSLMSSHDFEEAASENLSAKAWAFYSSASTDLITMGANASLFGRIWLRPRVMVDVKRIDTRARMLGSDISFPLFVSPAALAKLAHPDGEMAIAGGCERPGIAQVVSHQSRRGHSYICIKAILLTWVDQISTNASYPLPEIAAAAKTPLFFQLYVNRERSASEKLVRQAEQAGVRAIFVTVDQPTPPKREADERVRADSESLQQTPTGAAAREDAKGSGLGRTMGGFIDPALTWRDLAWLRGLTRLPIVLKGVQTAEDAVRAAEYGVDGLLIGNHGGRSLDTSTPAILVLLELRRRCPEVFDKLEVYLDGGIRRGTDIFKAVCLGAKAVGMGRHFLYAVNYGPEGVEHLIDSKFPFPLYLPTKPDGRWWLDVVGLGVTVLTETGAAMKDEFDTTMRMMGCTDLSQLHPGLLNTCDVDYMIPGAGAGGPPGAMRSKL